MKRLLISTVLAGALFGSGGAALAQPVPPANADERAPCTAQLASAFGPATTGIADEVRLVAAIAARLGVPQGQLAKVAASTHGTVAECVALLESL